MGFKRNKVKVDLCSYPPYIFLAERKFGKTTFWYNLVRDVWSDDEKGLLISFGNEEGYHALDGIQVEVAKKWDSPYDEETDSRGFVQIVNDIVENNEEYGIKGVCFDTLDTMVDVCAEEVLRQHLIEKKTKCKSLNDAFGGYGKGVERLVALIREQEMRLRDAGLAVFYLCHTKNKEKTDLKTGEKYEQITNNLQGNIYTKIADAAQMVIVGVMDRDIVNGKVTNEKRVLYLRGTSEVDAGSRFTDLPEKIEFTVPAFMDAFKSGVYNSINASDSDKEKIVATRKKEEEKESKKKAAISKKKEEEEMAKGELESHRDEYIENITSGIPKSSTEVKKKFQQILKDAGYSRINDPDIPIEILDEINKLL